MDIQSRHTGALPWKAGSPEKGCFKGKAGTLEHHVVWTTVDIQSRHTGALPWKAGSPEKGCFKGKAGTLGPHHGRLVAMRRAVSKGKQGHWGIMLKGW